ncbi:MAG: GNAT family N-acetyltransferase [Deltaproteobacteria bacterium]
MITYISGQKELLDAIEPLWWKLIEHHKARSEHFRHEFEAINFNIRKRMLEDKARDGMVLVEIAEDYATRKPVAYCISSINRFKQGELESIYVEDEFRGQRIGETMVKRSLSWMDQQGTYDKIVVAAVGNEEVLGFYARFGFQPRQILLKQT